MKKSYKMENLCCANCAAKMERQINKIDGVNANIAFMTQKLTIETEKDIDEVINEAEKIIGRIEKGCRIVR